MELANPATNGEVEGDQVRVAVRSDAGSIMRLLQTAVYRHLHVDWYVPGDWLGSPAFIVKTEQKEGAVRSNFVKFLGVRESVVACLAIAPDPEPVAWVRVAAVSSANAGPNELKQMLQLAISQLKQTQVNTIAWLTIEDWPTEWMDELGFSKINYIETYVKEDSAYPSPPDNPELDIRPVLDKDIEQLARLEAKTFNGLWRHSARGLRLAKNQSFSFDVALLNGQAVGFQLSTPNDYGVHLVRMTVDPALQKRGIGTALMAHAMKGYHRRERNRITLNTQVDNIASRQLYTKFGFKPSGQKFPVWAMRL